MPDRIATRYGQEASQLIMRFILTERLDVGSSATAQFVYFDGGADDYFNDSDDFSEIEVNSTFFRSHGFVGEKGWAIYMPDSDRWEVISMEASLIRTATAGAVITTNGTGNVTITDGTHSAVVTATNWGQSSTAISDLVTVFYDPSRKGWFIIGGGTGADEGKIVTVYSGTANANCMWPGKIAAPVGDASSHCTDQFPNGIDCLIVVLNSTTGSTGSKEGLSVGEHYLGRHVGDYDNGDDTFTPVYAIRTDSSSQKPVTPFTLTYRLVWGTNAVSPNAIDNDPPGTDPITVLDPTLRTWEGYPGAMGWAQETDTEGVYNIIWMENTARATSFVLQAGLTLITLGSNYQGLPSGSATIGIFDEAGLFPRRQSGANGIGFYDPEFDRCIPLNMETQAGWVAGVLDAKMDLDAATVAASINLWGGSQQDVQEPPDDEIVLRQLLYGHALDVADFIGIYDSPSGIYLPVVVDQKALLIECKAYTSFESEDVTVEVLDVRRLTPFPFSGEDPTITTVNNPFGFSGGDDALLLCAYDEFAERYEIVAVPPDGVIFAGQAYANFGPYAEFDSAFGGHPNPNVTIVDIKTLRDGEQQKVSVEASNPLALAGNAGDLCYVVRATHLSGGGGGSFDGWTLLHVERRAAVLEGYVYADFTREDAQFTMSIYRALQGRWPEPTGIPDALALTITVKNFNIALDVAEDEEIYPASRWHKPGPYLHAGKAGAACRAIWDDIDKTYRVVWVEEPGPIVLVQVTADIAKGEASTDYQVITGNSLSSEDTAWVNAGPAANRSRLIKDNEFCLMLWCPQGWYLVPLKAESTTTTTRTLQGTLFGTLLVSNTTCTIASVTTLSGINEGIGTVTATNKKKWAGSNGELCFVIEETDSDGGVTYHLDSVEWDTVEPVFNVFTAVTNLLRQTKQAILGKTAGSATDSTIDTGTTCP